MLFVDNKSVQSVHRLSHLHSPIMTLIILCIGITKIVISFLTDRSRQTVQTQIRLLLEEKSDQVLHCLQFHLHLFDEIP